MIQPAIAATLSLHVITKEKQQKRNVDKATIEPQSPSSSSILVPAAVSLRSSQFIYSDLCEIYKEIPKNRTLILYHTPSHVVKVVAVKYHVRKVPISLSPWNYSTPRADPLRPLHSPSSSPSSWSCTPWQGSQKCRAQCLTISTVCSSPPPCNAAWAGVEQRNVSELESRI